MSALEEQYYQALEQMLQNGRLWLAANKGQFKIEFRFPKHMLLLGTVTQALETGAIRADGSGLKFVEAVCGSLADEVTISMLQAVMVCLQKENDWRDRWN